MTQDPVQQNKAYAWIALATCCLLLIPLVGMQVSSEVDWGIMDFAVMGVLVFGAGSLYVQLARRMPKNRRPLLLIAVVSALVYLWAELAVGIFFSLGS